MGRLKIREDVKRPYFAEDGKYWAILVYLPERREERIILEHTMEEYGVYSDGLWKITYPCPELEILEFEQIPSLPHGLIVAMQKLAKKTKAEELKYEIIIDHFSPKYSELSVYITLVSKEWISNLRKYIKVLNRKFNEWKEKAESDILLQGYEKV